MIANNPETIDVPTEIAEDKVRRAFPGALVIAGLELTGPIGLKEGLEDGIDDMEGLLTNVVGS